MDHPRANDPHWFSLWSWLLLLATHQPLKMMFGSEVITLKPGQLITSRESLQRRTGINQHKIDRLIKVLKSEHQIEQVTSSTSRLITILNWEQYQDCEQRIEQQLSSECAAVEQQLSTNKNIRIKEHKNIRTKREAILTTDEQLELLKINPAYEGIDVLREFHKMLSWCNANGRTPSHRTFINWLNKADKPMRPVNGPKFQPPHRIEKAANEFPEPHLKAKLL